MTLPALGLGGQAGITAGLGDPSAVRLVDHPGLETSITPGEYDLTRVNLTRDGFRTIHAGDDYPLLFQLKLSDGQPRDLSTGTIVFSIAEYPAFDQPVLVLSSEETLEVRLLVPLEDGLVLVNLASERTSSLRGHWHYRLRFLDTGLAATLCWGRIEII